MTEEFKKFVIGITFAAAVILGLGLLLAGKFIDSETFVRGLVYTFGLALGGTAANTLAQSVFVKQEGIKQVAVENAKRGHVSGPMSVTSESSHAR